MMFRPTAPLSPFPVASATIMPRIVRARKRMHALACGDNSILSITPGKSILKPEALKKLQMAYLHGNSSVPFAGAEEDNASKRRKIGREASSASAAPPAPSTPASPFPEKDDEKLVFTEEEEKQIDEAAYSIANELVEWSTTFTLIDDLHTCRGEVDEGDDDGDVKMGMKEEEKAEKEEEKKDANAAPSPASPATPTPVFIPPPRFASPPIFSAAPSHHAFVSAPLPVSSPDAFDFFDNKGSELSFPSFESASDAVTFVF